MWKRPRYNDVEFSIGDILIQKGSHFSDLKSVKKFPLSTMAIGKLRLQALNGVLGTYLLLLAITMLGSYMILYTPSQPRKTPPLPDREHLMDEKQLEKEIENTKDRIFNISYYPVFKKHYPRFYNKKIKADSHDTDSQKLPQKESVKNKRLSQDKTTSNSLHNLWMITDKYITKDQLFPDSDHVEKTLHALGTAKIVHVDFLDIGDYESGTAEKWVVALDGGQKAVVKLVWEEKGTQKKDGLCNYGYEMPWSEIAAFHLHRILGFRNTPYVTGRVLNLKELLSVASPAVSKQFIFEAGGDICILGKCFFCNSVQKLCPPNGFVEASIGYWVPRHLKLYTWWPKYMPFSTPRREEWGKIGFNNKTFCDKVRREIEPYAQDQFYLDLFDFAILDTLMYHFDSKHYAIDDKSSAHGSTVRLDHGRAFCAYDKDEEEIFLAPLMQCCVLRRSTYNKLKTFNKHQLLSRRLHQAIKNDPIAPVLDEKWYPAIERRLELIFQTIDKCAKANGGLDHILV